MTLRLPPSVKYINWRDGQQVNLSDMDTEQSHNLQLEAATSNNFFGSGLLVSSPTRIFIFDSDQLTPDQAIRLAAGDFDGYGVAPALQPTDTSLGAQLEIELTDSTVYGRFTVKVLVLGLDFQGNLQYEKFIFYRNEVQVGKKHFANVLSILFNDFKSNHNGSRDFGGRITIKEALPFQLSRDAVMSSQDVEPDLFFRDFKVADPTVGPNPTTALLLTLQQAVGAGYDPDTLLISTTWLDLKRLVTNDIATRYGQKFLAKTSNIQKITLLLGVELQGTIPANYYDWTGELIINIHALQTSVACLSDVVPTNAIDFPPEPVPLAQISVNQATLLSKGYVLTDILQPVDFLFTNTKVGQNTNSGIIPDTYYLFSIQRSGDTTSGVLFTASGSDRTSNAQLSIFNGSVWTDVTTEELWYEIWSDAAKVSDGMGIDAGNGLYLAKTITDTDTGATIDYSKDGISFANDGQNISNFGVVQAIITDTDQVQDQRTGNPVFSKELYEPSISLVSSADLTTLQEAEEPIVLGNIVDTNPKNNFIVTGTQSIIGLAYDDTICVLNPGADLLSVNLVGAKITPNIATAYEYRIFEATLCVDGYGDVNADGYVSSDDLAAATVLLGEGLSKPTTQAKIAAGLISPLEIIRADVDGDGYVTPSDIALIAQYLDKTITVFPVGTSFSRLCMKLSHNVGRQDGYWDGGDGWIRTWNPSLPFIPIPTDPIERLYYGKLDPVLVQVDTALIAVSFSAIAYRVQIEPFWREDLIRTTSCARLIPCTFTSLTKTATNSCDIANPFECSSTIRTPVCDGGENNFFVPDNLIIGNGQILGIDGKNHAIDLEIQTITINMPDIPIVDGYLSIGHLFIFDRGDGFTLANMNAMKFSDCSNITAAAIANNQLRFSVAIQSYSPNLDGNSPVNGFGIIVDPNIGVYMSSNAVLYFSVANLVDSNIDLMLKTKIQITVYAKKAGWKNRPIEISSNQIVGLMALS